MRTAARLVLGAGLCTALAGAAPASRPAAPAPPTTVPAPGIAVWADYADALAAFERGDYKPAADRLTAALAAAETAFGADDPRTATVLTDLGRVWAFTADYSRAEPALRRAVSIGERRAAAKQAATDDPDLARARSELAGVLSALSEDDAAQAQALAAVAALEKARGRDHPSLVDPLCTLAAVRLHGGKGTEADALFRRALAIAEKDPANAYNLGQALVNVGELLARRDKNDEADRYLRRAADVLRAAYGERHALYGLILVAQGEQLFERGRGDEGAEVVRRGMAIEEAAFGGPHPWVAGAYDDLAAAALRRGDAIDAERCLKKSLDIRRQTLPARHPSLVGCMEHLGNVYSGTGRLSDAEAIQVDVVKSYEEARDFAHMTNALNGLGNTYFDMGEYTKSEAALRRGVEAGTKAVGEKHLVVTRCQSTLAMALAAQNKGDEALRTIQAALAAREGEDGKDAPTLGEYLESYTFVLTNVGRPDDAVAALDRAVAIGRKQGAADALNTARLTIQLAHFRAGMGKGVDAVPGLVREGLAAYEARYGADGPEMVVPLDAAEQAYRLAGLTADADATAERLQKLRARYPGPRRAR